MTRRSPSFAAAIALALTVAPALQAQVGHTPQDSPYQDLRGRQGLTLGVGALATGGDPAGVGPRSGALLNARYEIHLTGPLWAQGRLSYAPSLDRTVKDPALSGDARIVTTSQRPYTMLEVGFGVNLTGQKSWRRVVPQFHTALGWAGGGTSQLDVGDYTFGNRFTFSYGLGARIVTGREWELHADLTHLLWKNRYPASYAADLTTTGDPILPDGKLNAWSGNAMLSVGMTRYFFR